MGQVNIVMTIKKYILCSPNTQSMVNTVCLKACDTKQVCQTAITKACVCESELLAKKSCSAVHCSLTKTSLHPDISQPSWTRCLRWLRPGNTTLVHVRSRKAAALSSCSYMSSALDLLVKKHDAVRGSGLVLGAQTSDGVEPATCVSDFSAGSADRTPGWLTRAPSRNTDYKISIPISQHGTRCRITRCCLASFWNKQELTYINRRELAGPSVCKVSQSEESVMLNLFLCIFTPGGGGSWWTDAFFITSFDFQTKICFDSMNKMIRYT